ncbi:MAG: MFS transporter [Thermomicrobiales bacterium]|nr:MFS transporter [Thermomicrobiales bacterium]
MGATIHDEAGVTPSLPDVVGFAPTPDPGAIDDGGPLVALGRHPGFLLFWGADAISQIGSQISALALPLIAVTMLQSSPFEVGLLAALGWTPFVVVGLFAGVWVDRLRRRPVMIAADLCRSVALAIVPVAALLGALRIETLYVAALITGTLTVFFDVAYVSYLPTLIDRRQLVEGNSRIEATASAAQIIGPGLGGVLVRLIGGPLATLVDAVSFLASAALLWSIEKPEPVPSAVARPDLRREIGEGFAMLRASRVLQALALSAATVSFAGFLFLSVYILFMSRDLGLDAGAIGLVLATGGLGALAGTLAAAPARARFGIGPTIVGALCLFGLTGLLAPLAVFFPRHALPMVVAAEFLQWMMIVIHDINAVSLRQAIVPDRLAGRVTVSVRLLSWGMRPLGSFLGGVLGGTIGLAGTLVVGEFGMLLAFVWLLFSPIRSLRSPEPLSDPAAPESAPTLTHVR